MSAMSKSERAVLRSAGPATIAGLVLSVFVIALSSVVCAQVGPGGANTEDGSLHFPVAHAHFASWCLGRLTITPEFVQYEPVQTGGKDHSFRFKRGQVTFINYWTVGAQTFDALEMKTAGATYHFWLLRRGDLQPARRADWRPLRAAPADSLILSLYYWHVSGKVPLLPAVRAVIAQARAAAGAYANNGGGSDAYSSAAAAQAGNKLNDRIFTNTYSNQVMHNSMNTINHMSHW